MIVDGELVATGSPDGLKAQVGGDTLEIVIEETQSVDFDRARHVVKASGVPTESESVGIYVRWDRRLISTCPSDRD